LVGVLGRKLAAGEKVQACLVALLHAQAGPGLHALLQLFLVFGRQLVKAVGQADPAALCQLAHGAQRS
jgi:hypothetical protein